MYMKKRKKFLSLGFWKISGRYRRGFTLIEVLIVMGIIAILAAVVIIAINPGRQFAQARNSQRTSNVNAILNAVGQNIADNKGLFNCASSSIPTSPTIMKSASGYDIAACIVPTYMAAMPFDPSATGAHYTDNTDYNSGYQISQDAATKRITISAPEALNASELSQTISVTR
jgi:prepilin-type N-terminal cleavage/methylation domain-containing protein